MERYHHSSPHKKGHYVTLSRAIWVFSKTSCIKNGTFFYRQLKIKTIKNDYGKV